MTFRPFPLLATCTLLVLGVKDHALAGSTAQPPADGASPAAAPLLRAAAGPAQAPYLLAVGPQRLVVQRPVGPAVRRPPLLPTPKPVEKAADATAKTAEAGPRKPAEPSAFSPDAPNTLLPTEKPAGPAGAQKAEPTESVLVPALRGEPELRDSVIYFETPAGPRGGQVTVPIPASLTSPSAAPLPPSRATYRKEKE